MVSGNRADYGGGMYNNGYEGVSSPVLTHVTVSDNSATDYGGGMYNDGIDGGVSSPLLTNGTISGNRAALAGGGILQQRLRRCSSPLLTNVIISGNSAGSGGGMVNEGFFHGESSSAADKRHAQRQPRRRVWRRDV